MRSTRAEKIQILTLLVSFLLEAQRRFCKLHTSRGAKTKSCLQHPSFKKYNDPIHGNCISNDCDHAYAIFYYFARPESRPETCGRVQRGGYESPGEAIPWFSRRTAGELCKKTLGGIDETRVRFPVTVSEGLRCLLLRMFHFEPQN